MVPDGTVFITVKGAGVETVFPGIEAAIGRDIYAFLPEDVVPSSFIIHALRFTTSEIVGQAQGDIPGLSKDHILGHTIAIPPIEEQKRIADIIDELLSDVDAGVAALERVQAKLKQYRAAVLNAAVGGALTSEWRAQHPVTEPASALLTRILAERRRRWEEAQLQKFKEAGKEPTMNWKAKYKEPIEPDTTKLEQLPEGWCWATFDQITELITKGTSPRWQGFQYQDSGIPFVRSQNIRWGRLDLADLEYLPLEFNDLHKGSIIRKGDVLLNLVGASIGRCAVATEEIDGANLNQAVGVIRLIQPGALNQWVITYVTSSHGQNHIHANKAEVARANFNLDDIRPMPVQLAPFSEQEAIIEAVEDQVSVIEHLQADIQAKLKSAQALRQSILHHAFTGQLVPQDPKDEPAAELLKRIAAEREERAGQTKVTKKIKPKAPPKLAAK